MKALRIHKPASLESPKILPLYPILPGLEQTKDLQRHLSTPEALRGKIALPMRGRIELIGIEDILFVKAESNYIRFFLKDQKCILMAKTMKGMSSQLEEIGFTRVHQSYMLSLARVKYFDTHKGTLVLIDGLVIPVSRANRKKIAAVLKRAQYIH